MNGYDDAHTAGQDENLPPSRFAAGYTVGPSTPPAPSPSPPSPPGYAPAPMPGYSYPVSPSAADGWAVGDVAPAMPPPMPPPMVMPAYPVAVGPPMYYQAPRATNSMAVAALVCSLVLAPLGILFGHIALSQINRTGEDGRGLAVAGLVIGYLFTGFFVLWLLMIGAFVGAVV